VKENTVKQKTGSAGLAGSTYNQLLAGLLCAVAVSAFAVNICTADEGIARLTFSGVLSHAPCKLDTESAYQRVDFGRIPVKNFYDFTTTARQPIVIRLLDCVFKTSQRVDIRFYGTEDGSQPGLLAVDGAAQGIAVRLTGPQDEPLRINQDKLSTMLHSGNNEIRLFASLKGSPEAVREKAIHMGEFHATASFVLQYP